MDKIARINMGAAGGPKVTVEDVGEYAGLGGRALTSLLIAKEVHPLCHALGAENKLVIAPGMLSGTAGAMTGRLSVGCKSPLTGTIKESNAGGGGGAGNGTDRLCRHRPRGKPEGDDLYKIYVNKDGIHVIVDNSLKDLDNYPVIEKLRKEYGDKVAYMSIGTAGERKLLAASIACTDPELRPTRHCGRGGVGAVMGAKRVKAIILDDAGMKMRPPKDPEKYRDANRKFVEAAQAPVTGEVCPRTVPTS
jgi:aldehyde:ferredoxin oxidoreductase